jgi:hypothetical protein
MSYDLLHRLAADGEIKGFLLPYLGQIDAKVPNAPADLVRPNAVLDYPTDFSPMTEANIELLTRRGEQLTYCLIDLYHRIFDRSSLGPQLARSAKPPSLVHFRCGQASRPRRNEAENSRPKRSNNG